MANDYGTGVSRVLTPDQTNFDVVIWQRGKPPLESELNLLQQISSDWRRKLVLQGTPSGWLGNAVNASETFASDATWSNWFRFGQQRSGEKASIPWASVNGWLIPVTATGTGTPPGSPNDSDTWNRITLDPPPTNSGDSRIDFVFLEVWQARLPPNPSADNKPSASGVWRYGNVESGSSFIADDIQDPALGFETSQRSQLQYRIRVVSGLVGLSSYPDGFDPTVVKAQGSATQVTSFTFENMREELGDPGLWRAGDGTANTLGSIDGYSYAIPLAAVFRRNTVVWDGDPGQNLNGSINRNPTAVDRTSWATFSTAPTLGADLNDSALSLSLATATDIPLPLTPATAVTIQVGDEIMTYSVITGTTMTLTARGVLGTKPEAHSSGDAVTILAIRPDGLFADQIAKTDILDLRKSVNPNGFDYDTLLQTNLDKLLRGSLRANWKRSGAGPQGPFVSYQDKISNSAAALGVTKLDGPDNIRQIFSDAAAQQQVTVYMKVPIGSGTAEDTAEPWGLSLSSTTNNSTAGQFNPADVITIPIAQFKTGLPGSDADQVRFLGSGDSTNSVVTLRIDGSPHPLTEGTHYSITASPGPADDLQITLEADFPAATTQKLEATVNVLYGPGRGMSRRPDSLHSVAYLSSGTEIMTQLSGIPADNSSMRVAWAPLWSKYRGDTFNNLLPVTAEAYADPGSRTIILSPFRTIDLPNESRALDGTSLNVNDQSTVKITDTNGSVADTLTFTSAGVDFSAAGVAQGDALVITAPASVAGVYPIGSNVLTTTLDLELGHTFVGTVASITYSVYSAQGLMPLLDRAGAAKWATTDPLDLFSGTTEGAATTKDLFFPIPRRLMPGWGEVRIPIIHSDPTTTPSGGTTTFDQGINFAVLTKKGSVSGKDDPEQNYIPFALGGVSFTVATTYDFIGATSATYNTAISKPGFTMAGMRFFSDSRGLGRKGLELPPFYGIARLFAIYEAGEWDTTGSAFDLDTREPDAGAANLLRQDFDGPVFWIEIDADGDSTFVLNADAIDITKATVNPISSFESGNYVIEANIFGFDRDSFSLNSDFRLVLSRERDAAQAKSGSRVDNFGAGITASIKAPNLVVPGPALAADEVAINYSRTPYQGDAWGTQANFQDIGHQPGSLLTGTFFQVSSTTLDELNLTRPNQKTVEVLSSIGFATTLGTGRMSGDLAIGTPDALDFRNVGYEDRSVLPPATAIDPRPPINVGALTSIEETAPTSIIGTEYHGCTERLPMGALYRDKDFRGTFVYGADAAVLTVVQSQLIYTKDRAPAALAVGPADSNLEQSEIPVHTASASSGQPGEMLVHVDGEQGNYALLTNYRTHRGGSVFTASGPRPGGEFTTTLQTAGAHTSQPGVLSGVAMLVRNTVTNVGATEVSAGSELMMLIVTDAKTTGAPATSLTVVNSTNGTAEGGSAADLYRIEGHPMVRDHVRATVDPSTITLTKALG